MLLFVLFYTIKRKKITWYLKSYKAFAFYPFSSNFNMQFQLCEGETQALSIPCFLFGCVFPVLLFHLDLILITHISQGSLHHFQWDLSDWENQLRLQSWIQLCLFTVLWKKAKMSLPVYYIRRCLSAFFTKKPLFTIWLQVTAKSLGMIMSVLRGSLCNLIM